MPVDLVRAIEALHPPTLNDASQLQYLIDQGRRHAVLYGEPMSVLHLRVQCAERRTVALLRARLRETDAIARTEDGSFAVLLPATDLMDATIVGEKLRMRAPMSVGVACSDAGMGDLWERAKSAMRKAEERGGDRVCF